MKPTALLGSIVAGLLCVSVHAHAVTHCTIGVKGGMSIANVGGDDADSVATDSRNGFAGGAFFQADVSKNFGVRVEALYTMKGASDTSEGFDATFKFDYFEFPILLVGQVPASESVTLSAFVGPTLGFNVKSEAEVTFLGVTGSQDIEDIASFEFGIAFGAGVTFDMGSFSIVVDGRYAMGMTTIDDSDDNLDVKNQGFIAMAGIGFPIGGAE